MKIDHIGVWVSQLEVMKEFYVKAFKAVAGERYHNPKTGFSSYFLRFSSGARLELMQMAGISDNPNNAKQQAMGFVHLALAVGSAAEVDRLTEQLTQAGAPLLSPPHLTGDAYYESVVQDPEGNRIEITI